MVKRAFLSREPVINKREFIGRKAEIDWLADKLGRQMPQNCNLVGEPRIGKTTLMYYAYSQQIGLPPGENGLYVWVRLAELPIYDSLNFWRLMTRKLCQAQIDAGLSEESLNLTSKNPLEIFDILDECLEQLLDRSGVPRLVLFIDDFDLLLGQNGIGKQDLDWLRALATRYSPSLAFVISSVDSLVALTERLTGTADVSPFANMFHHLSIGLLPESEAEVLCRQAAAVEEVPLSAADLEFLLLEAGRHPDLLKIACGYLFVARGLDTDEDVHAAVAGDVRLDDRVRWLARRLAGRRSAAEFALLGAIHDGETAVADPILWNRLQKHVGLVEMRAGKPALFADAFDYWLGQASLLKGTQANLARETAVPPINHQAERRLAIINGREIELTSLENRLLAYFMEHANEVCTIEALLDNVWGPGKSTAVVEKAVNRLRSKIEQDPKRPRYLLAARGEGYRLVT